jgi:hypothetical protein
MSARNVRILFVTVVASVLTAGICFDAVAKTHRRSIHADGVVSESLAQLAFQQPSRLGPMRYYGGPKSPMWRGPAEN